MDASVSIPSQGLQSKGWAWGAAWGGGGMESSVWFDLHQSLLHWVWESLAELVVRRGREAPSQL